MKNFRKIFSLILSVLLVMSVLLAANGTVSAEEVTEEAFLEGFSGNVDSNGFVNGWSGDSSHWEIVTVGSNQAEYYKGDSAGGATITSPAVDLSKYTSVRMYISIGVKEGLTLDDSNTLKILISDGASYSKTAFNLHTGTKYDTVKSENAVLKSFWFDIDSFLPSNKSSIQVKITALGAYQYYIDDITLVGTYEGESSTTTTEGSNGNKAITSVSVNLNAPAVNSAQPTSVSGTGFTGTIVWNPAETFVAGTPYTATFTLTAQSGYEFAGNASVSVSSSTAQNISITSSQITFTAVYSIEATAIKITKISYDYVTRTTAQLVMETSGSDTVLESYFEYGTSIGAYTGKSVDGALTDLSSNTIYYYRAVVVTANGQITSEPSSFKTASGITIVTKSSSGGSVSPFGTSEVATGENLTVTVTPDEGYVINFVTVDDIDVELAADNTYTFSNIGEDHVLYAAFKPSAAATGTTGGKSSWFVKFIIIFLGVVLAALIFFFFVKPKGMSFGDIVAGFIVKIRRWNFRRKNKSGKAGRSRSRSREADDFDDFGDDDEYGYGDDDDFDDGLPLIGQDSEDITSSSPYEHSSDSQYGETTGGSAYQSGSFGGYDDFEDDFSKKYDFDRFK
ncbi:MAG: hypothetical protein ACI4QV_03025 [Acutalibacteraceae bacterium]